VASDFDDRMVAPIGVVVTDEDGKVVLETIMDDNGKVVDEVRNS